ncbi:MAG TPA: hypothetical protein VFI32_00695, partial [Rhodanobacteraceae bacterium]|nr:hypothetical protein [Rhodanobacteraceae bacterium]
MNRNRLSMMVAVALLCGGGMELLGMQSAQAQVLQTTAFTYQGQLIGSGGPVTSAGVTFIFTLQDTLGNPVAAPTNPVTVQVPVVDGLFTANVDFGLVFGANQYQVQVQVQDTNGTYTLGTQPVNSVPVAQYALSSGNNMGPTGPTGATGATGADGATGATG